MSLEPQQLVDGRYRLHRKLGEGGFGAVWLAEETALERLVAIKFIEGELSHQDRVRFQREVQALGRLNHDHVIKLYRSGEVDGTPYVATEFARGQTLAQWALASHSIDEILSIATQMASALAAAHGEGIVHRDLKPANVIVSSLDGMPFAKVLDFGIAKLTGKAQADITKTGEIIGTPGFMSPEQLRGLSDIGPATDLYNLGVILWEIIEQRPMFTADTALGMCMRHLTEPAPPLTRPVPAFLGALIMRLLDKDPRRRGTAELALRTLQTRGAPAAPVEPHTPPQAARVIRPLAVGLIAVAALAVAGAVWFAAQPDADAPPPPPTMENRLARLNATREAPPTPVVKEEAPEPVVSMGCGADWPSGQFVASSPLFLDRTEATLARADDQSIFYVPPSYDPSRRVPLVVVLHDGGELPSEMFAEARQLVERSDANGFVLLFAEGGRVNDIENLLGGTPRIERPMASYAWEKAERDYVLQLTLVAMEAFCIDPDEVFLIGHGRGARGAEALLATTETFRAVAMAAYRRKAEDPFLQTEPIPYLWLNPTDSPRYAADHEAQGCSKGYDHAPLAQQERDMRELNGCRGQPRRFESPTGATCETWTCEVPFVSCRVEGGRHWAGYTREEQPCDGPISSYDYGGQIWAFFGRVSHDR